MASAATTSSPGQQQERRSASAAAAVQFVHAAAEQQRAAALRGLEEVSAMSNLPDGTVQELVQALRQHARIAVHFHPDRTVTGRGHTVAESMLTQGVIQSQFESNISNGKLDPSAGGKRDQWENQLFGQAYKESKPVERPKYGALALLGQIDGPAPRFGSCYFLLSPGVSRRSTYCFGDSHAAPVWRGTNDCWETVLGPLLEESFTRDGALGVGDRGAPLRPAALVRRALSLLRAPLQAQWQYPAARNLDHYIEAQVHGPLSLLDDVDALVADASFQATETGAHLAAMAARYQIQLHWRPRSELAVADIPSDFRGPQMPVIGGTVARGNALLSAALIGETARSCVSCPGSHALCVKLGSVEAALQHLKLLWHCVLRYGSQAECHGVEHGAANKHDEYHTSTVGKSELKCVNFSLTDTAEGGSAAKKQRKA
jgi:hypothetical protein